MHGMYTHVVPIEARNTHTHTLVREEIYIITVSSYKRCMYQLTETATITLIVNNDATAYIHLVSKQKH